MCMYGCWDSFTGSGAGSVTVELSVEVNVTYVVVTGLTPGANYTLSVTAENAVSSQDTTGRNVISISARTVEGGILGMWICPEEEGGILYLTHTLCMGVV